MENIPKNLTWIINRMQQIMFNEDHFKAHKHLFKEFGSVPGNLTTTLSQYATIEILEINEEEGFYLINPKIKSYKKIKVFKDKYEIIED